MQRSPGCLVLTSVLVLLALAITTTTATAATSTHFKSPSGNINCMVESTEGGFAQCLVKAADWPATPRKPASCDLDWAPYQVQLFGKKVSLGGCRGDVGPRCYAGSGHCTVLAYGRGVTVGSIRCDSSTSGITCRRTKGSRPGFRVAREGVKVYA